MSTPGDDGLLLEKFAMSRDEAAFELIVRRHSALVLNACRRVLGSSPDAEDAAQATFLILARKAGKLASSSSVAPWLLRVARQVALNASKARETRRKHEQRVAAMPRPETSVERQEFQRVLDAEVDALPEKYRKALVLHHFAGHSEAETAGLLGCPEGTACTWLARGRELLRDRLARRGLVLTLAGICSLLSAEAGAAELPVSFVPATLETMRLAVTGKLAASSAAVAPPAVALSEGVLKTMFWMKLKMACLAVISASLLGSLTGLAAYHAWAEEKAPPKEEQKEAGGAAASGKKSADDSAVYDKARFEKAPVVLRVKFAGVPPPGGVPRDEVEVLKVLKNTTDEKWAGKVVIAYDRAGEGVPHQGECTAYLQRREMRGGERWALLGGGSKEGVSHASNAEPGNSGPKLGSGAADPVRPNPPNDRNGARGDPNRP